MKTILFWDIDGTLLTTGKAGVPAWEAAVKEVTGKDFQLSSIRVPGLTDFQIAARANPTRSLRCSMLVEPRPLRTTRSIASSSRSSPSSSTALAPPGPLSSPCSPST